MDRSLARGIQLDCNRKLFKPIQVTITTITNQTQAFNSAWPVLLHLVKLRNDTVSYFQSPPTRLLLRLGFKSTRVLREWLYHHKRASRRSGRSNQRLSFPSSPNKTISISSARPLITDINCRWFNRWYCGACNYSIRSPSPRSSGE